MASAKLQLYKFNTLKDGSHPVVIQILHERRKKLLWLGHYVKPENWNEEENLPKSNHPNSTRARKYLRTKLNLADDVILRLKDDDLPFTVDDIINELSETKSPKSFFTYTDQVIQKLERLNKVGNARVYQNTLNVFKKYRDDKDIYFKHIDVRILKGFEEYLQSENCKVNTISNHLRTLRAIYNRAIKDKVVKEAYYPFKNFSIRSESTKKRAISKDDIDLVRDYDLSDNPELEEARDYFLFSFYNRGMSFIDVAFLKV